MTVQNTTKMSTTEATKFLIREQYRKCALDPIYFLIKYSIIQHPTCGKIPFVLYPFQEEVLNDFRANRFNIILKSRQLGLSTLVAGYICWLMTFYDEKNILVIATKQDVAKNLITKVRVMHQNLPSWMRVRAREDNKLSLVLENGSLVKCVSSSGDSGRSEGLSLLVLDEGAFIDKIDEIWTAALPTLSTGGDCIVLSTPNGVGNWFHQQWVKAVGGEVATSADVRFKATKLHWSVHPERDQRWRDEQTELLGAKKAAQECDTDFLSSGEGLVDPSILKFYEETYIKPPLEKRGVDHNLWIWEYPNYSSDYIVCADVARGDGNDYSAAHVIDIQNLRQVAEYKGMVDTKTYGDLLVSLATEYNDALLIIEREGIGWATIQQVIDRSYPNMFYSSADLKYIDTLRNFNNKIYTHEQKMVAGFATTAKTRPLIISKIETFLREGAHGDGLIIQSKRLIDELYTFIWNGNRVEAMRGYNDDLAMSLGIGLWVRDTALRLRQAGVELTKKTLDGFAQSTVPTIYQPGTFMNDNPYHMVVGNGEIENLASWFGSETYKSKKK